MEETIIEKQESTTPDTTIQTEKKPFKINKKAIIIFAIVIILIVSFYFIRGFFIVATVNGESISRWSIIRRLEKMSGQDLLESMITKKLIEREVASKKVVVNQEDVDSHIKRIQDLIVGQGGTLEEELSMQGLTIEGLKEQILLQKQLEKLIADKIIVTNQEIEQYIQDNDIEILEGQDMVMNEQIRNILTGSKINIEAQILINRLKAEAKIKYFVKY